MTPTTRNRLGLALLALLLIGGFLALLLLPGCKPKPDEAARLKAERDDARDSLAVCLGQSRQQQAQLEYGQITRSPASGWTDDSLARFLTNPYGVHPEGGRRPQR